MSTTTVSQSVQQVVERELTALGFSASKAQSISKGLFNRRIRRLAQIASGDARDNNGVVLSDAARRATCKFLCNDLGYESIHQDAVDRLVPLNVEDWLRETAARQRGKAKALPWMSRANIVAFLKSQLGERFATTFYLCLPLEESWRLFWRKIVARQADSDGVVYRDPGHLHAEFATFYSNRPLLEWPKQAMDLLKLGLKSLLCRKIDSREIISVYFDILVRLHGLDGQSCVQDPGKMKIVANNLATTKQMIFTLQQALGSPEGIRVFTVVAQHFSDEFAGLWKTLLPISESMEKETRIITLDSPLRALFAATTYTPYVNCLEDHGVTNLRQLCGLKIEMLRSIPGLRRQVTDSQSVMAKKLATVGLRLGMSIRSLANWEQPPRPP